MRKYIRICIPIYVILLSINLYIYIYPCSYLHICIPNTDTYITLEPKYRY